MPISHADLDNWFSYHAPVGQQANHYGAIRAAAKIFAEVILELTPPSADQTVAIRSVREAVHWANAAIACNPPVNTVPSGATSSGAPSSSA